ncbi:Maf-like protein [Thermococcus gammatolerans]|uniref:dTTP/UTP pyrophosphatase n=1 Tax=Thermococcus gammatolerans (strain DSM 15229 / JCM 11827 / EJ3) TaxID=593117 RepID=NTPPA_THEGJ|nr:Maf-like protein [Thermococcus gammatolerans]C5A216.1 RecName: Full=dTTP/UTP pyrophosphatase; Short=dTTPase/UTPase; AltName: Full=Nucleoside triphosphate pyrophosphatase; AltName: Full=Nucleotide pyrophosphatase; Short=Nucleotide PPase [Thermococcus gammatolerans EJ3]ACS34435.1 Nucleotide-binding protein, Maf septum formation protein (maf) [Thermococcus gammatolerans EJ3]
MLVLASASPRRREILSRFIRDFHVVPSNAEERCSGTPEECAVELARLKAREVYSRVGGTVIGADTVVSIDGRVLGKPSDEGEAYRMLKLLSGRVHRVTTGYCIIHEGKEIAGSATTEVKFRELDDELIWAYIRTGEPMDKAGAYGIQGKAGLFVEWIRGDYYNVVGFPMEIIWKLRELGFEVLSR